MKIIEVTERRSGGGVVVSYERDDGQIWPYDLPDAMDTTRAREFRDAIVGIDVTPYFEIEAQIKSNTEKAEKERAKVRNAQAQVLKEIKENLIKSLAAGDFSAAADILLKGN